MVTKTGIARTPTDVRRQIASTIDSINYIIYAPFATQDRSRIDLYVIHTDSTIGTFRGLGSRCVTKFESFGENLIVPGPGGDIDKGGDLESLFVVAVSAAEERIRRLQGVRAGNSLAAVSGSTLPSFDSVSA